MAESFFEEMRRYVAFGAEDEEALRTLAPHAAPRFASIADEFYRRLDQHEEARRVLADDAQRARLKRTLRDWLRLLLTGPWDERYYQHRAEIGRAHVRIALPQRYMFGAMSLVRLSLLQIAHDAIAGAGPQRRIAIAVDKILDLELAVMLESYADTLVDRRTAIARAEKDALLQRLELSEARYHGIVETSEALIATWEPGGRIVQFNRSCEDLTGVSRDRARERTWAELFGGDGDRVAHREAELLAGGATATVETTVRDRAGREHRIRWHHTILHEPGRSFVCAIGLDVSEQQQLALRTSRAERLASLGTMAAGLAHEVRNPLNAAHLQLALVERQLARATPDVAGAREAAGLAASHIKRLAVLVSEFLDFGRPHALQTTPGDLRITVNAIIALLRPEAELAGVTLVCESNVDPIHAAYDDEKIKQVLLNLIRNAIEATAGGGNVLVRVTSRGDTATLEVEDSGPGLAAVDAPLFEPFYTTKETGTGLGLPIVHRIVTDHGGVVDVRSQPGQTVFSVTLPAGRASVDNDA